MTRKTDAVEKVGSSIGRAFPGLIDRVAMGGVRLDPICSSRERCMSWSGRRPDGSECQGFEVLYDCCQVEFVADTGKTSEPHSFESVVDLQVSKAHLNTFAFVT